MYPWGDLAQGATICDVGGGNGHLTAEVVKAFPGLRLVVQDLPVTKELGIEVRRAFESSDGILIEPIYLSYG